MLLLHLERLQTERRVLQVYSIPKVLAAWSHFYFFFHWGCLAMMLARALLPRKRHVYVPQGAHHSSPPSGPAPDGTPRNASATGKGRSEDAQETNDRHEL